MTLRGWALVGLVLVLTIAAGWWYFRPTGALSIELTGLPEGARGQVDVSGPDGFQQRVEQSEKLKVAPGDYLVRVHPANLAEATTYAADEEMRVAVPAHGEATAAAAYKIRIPSTTKILDPEHPGLLTPATGDQLAFDPAARKFEPGDTIVIAEGPQTPSLVVRRVTATKPEQDRVLVDTVQVGLEEAIPRGVIRLDDLADRPHSRQPSGDEISSLLLEIDTLQNRFGSCGGSGAAPRITLRVRGFDLSLKGTDLEWSIVPWHRFVEAKVKVNLRYEAEASLDAHVAGACKHEDEIKIVKTPRKLGKLLAKLLRAGPISLSGSLNVFGEVKAAASGGVKAAWKQKTDISVGGTVRAGSGAKRDAELTGLPSQYTSTTPEVESDATLSYNMGFRLRFAGGDPLNFIQGGPRIDFGDGIELKATRPKVELFQVYSAAVVAQYKIGPWEPELTIGEWKRRTKVWSGAAGPFKSKGDQPSQSMCPSDDAIKSSLDLGGGGYDLKVLKVCAGRHIAARVDTAAGRLPYSYWVGTNDGGTLSWDTVKSASDYTDMGAPRCDFLARQDKPARIVEFFGCQHWTLRDSVSVPSVIAEHLARHRELSAALASGDHRDVCARLDSQTKAELNLDDGAAPPCESVMDKIRSLVFGSIDQAYLSNKLTAPLAVQLVDESTAVVYDEWTSGKVRTQGTWLHTTGGWKLHVTEFPR